MNNWFTPTVFFVLLNVVIATIALTSTLANQKQHIQQTQSTHQHTPKVVGSPSVLQRLRSINFSNFRSQEPVFKFNPDSDTLFNLDPTHHPQILQPQMGYSFYRAPQENPNLESHTTHYIFRQDELQDNETHYVSPQENEAHYVSPQERPNLETPTTHFVFRQDELQGNVEQSETHDEKTEEIEAHFDFQVAHEEEKKPKRVDADHNESPEPSAGDIPAKMRKSASMKSDFTHFEKDDVEARRPATTKERATEVDEEVDAKADDFINKFRQQLKLQRVESVLRNKEVMRRGAKS